MYFNGLSDFNMKKSYGIPARYRWLALHWETCNLFWCPIFIACPIFPRFFGILFFDPSFSPKVWFLMDLPITWFYFVLMGWTSTFEIVLIKMAWLWFLIPIKNGHSLDPEPWACCPYYFNCDLAYWYNIKFQLSRWCQDLNFHSSDADGPKSKLTGYFYLSRLNINDFVSLFLWDFSLQWLWVISPNPPPF